LPIQILKEGVLRIRYDHVIEEMLTHLGAIVERAKAPFVPESGPSHRQPRRAPPRP
jgi:urease accessory protein UreE